ncbi:MAG TPA: YjfB family protein [Rectinemataceae bacterium]|nr:YjfB family protein [Rectinemataceae bacterium]
MDIQGVSMDLAQSRLLDQVSVAMLSKSLKGAQEQSGELLKMLSSAAPLPEGSGQKVDLFA